MPGYKFMAERNLTTGDMSAHLKTLKMAGVPYTNESIAKANEDLATQADPNADSAELVKRYPKAQSRDFDGDPSRITEMDALVAYLQMLGTQVDYKSAAPQERER